MIRNCINCQEKIPNDKLCMIFGKFGPRNVIYYGIIYCSDCLKNNCNKKNIVSTNSIKIRE